MKGQHLKFIIVGVVVCYAAVIYGQDLMETMRMREERTREIMGPEFGAEGAREPKEVAPKEPPRSLPPADKMPKLRPKNPVYRPGSAAEAAQYVRGERMEARVQGTLYLHQKGRKGLGILRDLLQGGRRDARAAAVAAMGWMRDASALPDMSRAVSDPDPRVRQTLAAVLGLFEGAEAVTPLGRLTRDTDARVRATAAESLGLLRRAESIDALNPLLEDEDEMVRERAALALKEIWTPRKAAEAKEEPKPPPVSAVVRGASLKGLLRCLEADPVARVRSYAAEALGGVGDRTALPGLIRRLNKDEDEFVRYGAALAIGRLGGGSKEAEMALRHAQAEDSSALVNRGVYEALRRLKLTPAARPGEKQP